MKLYLNILTYILTYNNILFFSCREEVRKIREVAGQVPEADAIRKLRSFLLFKAALQMITNYDDIFHFES